MRLSLVFNQQIWDILKFYSILNIDAFALKNEKKIIFVYFQKINIQTFLGKGIKYNKSNLKIIDRRCLFKKK